MAEDGVPVSTPLVEVAESYVRQLPEVRYTAVGVNPTVHVACMSVESANGYVTDTMLGPGRWRDFGKGLLGASVRLAFDIGGAKLAVSVDPSQRMVLDQLEAFVAFQGNIHRDLTHENPDDNLSQLCEVIRNWHGDYERFASLVHSLVSMEVQQ
jgi:hypothetical protein